ncbi:hypothetical protein JL720_13814 [Aureococcus anophagefferens]|nr:hypothetical protein JL720_13814 [Aureococcus anophagefferens]
MRNASTPRGSAKASKKARTPFSDQKNIKSASPKQKGARAAKKSARAPPPPTPPAPASPDRDFSKAEALAAAAAHVCSLRHQSDHPLLSGGGGSSGPTGVDGRGGAWHEVSFAAGPLGIEFEPEGVARGSGVETGCMVVRVHELASHPAQMVARRGVCAGDCVESVDGEPLRGSPFGRIVDVLRSRSTKEARVVRFARPRGAAAATPLSPEREQDGDGASSKLRGAVLFGSDRGASETTGSALDGITDADVSDAAATVDALDAVADAAAAVDADAAAGRDADAAPARSRAPRTSRSSRRPGLAAEASAALKAYKAFATARIDELETAKGGEAAALRRELEDLKARTESGRVAFEMDAVRKAREALERERACRAAREADAAAAAAAREASLRSRAATGAGFQALEAGASPRRPRRARHDGLGCEVVALQEELGHAGEAIAALEAEVDRRGRLASELGDKVVALRAAAPEKDAAALEAALRERDAWIAKQHDVIEAMEAGSRDRLAAAEAAAAAAEAATLPSPSAAMASPPRPLSFSGSCRRRAPRPRPFRALEARDAAAADLEARAAATATLRAMGAALDAPGRDGDVAALEAARDAAAADRDAAVAALAAAGAERRAADAEAAADARRRDAPSRGRRGPRGAAPPRRATRPRRRSGASSRRRPPAREAALLAADFFEADGRARDGQVRGAPADDGAGAGGDDDALDAEVAGLRAPRRGRGGRGGRRAEEEEEEAEEEEDAAEEEETALVDSSNSLERLKLKATVAAPLATRRRRDGEARGAARARRARGRARGRRRRPRGRGPRARGRRGRGRARGRARSPRRGGAEARGADAERVAANARREAADGRARDRRGGRARPRATSERRRSRRSPSLGQALTPRSLRGAGILSPAGKGDNGESLDAALDATAGGVAKLLAADLDATKASLDAALEKDRELNAFNTTICAFIGTIAGDGPPQASPAKKKQPAASL